LPRYLAIDVEAAGVSVATANLKGSTLTLERVLVLPDRGLGLSPSTAEALGVQLKELLKDAGIKPAAVLLNVGRDRVILKEIVHPPTAPAEEPLVVRFQAIKEISDAPDDMVMDYLPLGRAGLTGEQKALAVFIRKDFVNAARVMCDVAGLKLVGMIPRPFALGASLRRAIATGQVPVPSDPNGAFGIVTLSDAGGEFTVCRGSNVLYTRPVSAVAVRNDTTLLAELKRNLTIYGTQQPNAPLQGLYLPEATATAGASWANFLREELPVSVYGYDPLSGTNLAESVPGQVRSRLAASIGALALKAESDTLPINFVSPRQPRAERKALSPRVLIGALAAVLIFGLVVTVAYLELNKVDDLVTSRADKKNVLDSELLRLEPDTKRLEAAQEFRNREIVWLDELYDLATRVPDVDKASIVEIDGAALPPPKKEPPRPRATTPTTGTQPSATVPSVRTPTVAKKELPVASMRIVIRTSDPVYPQKISDDFSNDKFYAGVSKSKPNSQGEGKGDPTYTINTMVMHRGADKYTRQLKATMPKIEVVPDPEEAAQGGGNPGFGAGFGGFNP
jgi:hypothetical protein